jgi:hypothetical protein
MSDQAFYDDLDGTRHPIDNSPRYTALGEPRRRVSRPRPRVIPEPEVRLEQQIREEESRDRQTQ